MDLERLLSLLSRVFFVGAFALMALAVIERIANQMGYTIVVGTPASTLLEYSAIALVFVITMLLRQIRDALDSGSA